MKKGLGVSLDIHIEPYDDDHVLSEQETEEAKEDIRKLLKENEDMDLYVIGIPCKISRVTVKDIEEYAL